MFAVREFDTKVIRSLLRTAKPNQNEQAIRAAIRQNIASLALPHEKASKAEIRVLKLHNTSEARR